MKKLLTLALLLATFAPVNALALQDILGDKELAANTKTILQEIQLDKTNNKPYLITGLLYVGPATLRNGNKEVSLSGFTLHQKEGYITYTIKPARKADSFSLQIVPDNDKTNQSDPHRTETFYVVLKMFRDNKVIQEIGLEAMELEQAGIRPEGIFNIKYAVNAEYKKDKSYIFDEEPNTCGKRILLSSEKSAKTTYETITHVDHAPDCTDPRHCSCPQKMTATAITTYPQEVSFVVETEQCKKDTSCACPKYIMYR